MTENRTKTDKRCILFGMTEWQPVIIQGPTAKLANTQQGMSWSKDDDEWLWQQRGLTTEELCRRARTRGMGRTPNALRARLRHLEDPDHSAYKRLRAHASPPQPLVSNSWARTRYPGLEANERERRLLSRAMSRKLSQWLTQQVASDDDTGLTQHPAAPPISTPRDRENRGADTNGRPTRTEEETHHASPHLLEETRSVKKRLWFLSQMVLVCAMGAPVPGKMRNQLKKQIEELGAETAESRAILAPDRSDFRAGTTGPQPQQHPATLD